MSRRIVLTIAAVLALFVPTALVATSSRAVEPTAHFISNLKGSTAPADLGYDVFDTGPSGVDSLPTGVRGLVWLGQKCPTAADDAFRAKVDALAANPRVFGYYLSDEPHIADCPGGPAALKTRTDYIRSKTSTQYTFIVLSKQADVVPFAPANTGVHLIGLDPYPCSVANPTCDLRKIGERVGWADAAGISRDVLVPTFQAFGQDNVVDGYYRLPTPDQMRSMLAEWARFLPHPVMDYTYSWGVQPGTSDPTLASSTELQAVMLEHNLSGSSTSTPPPPKTPTATYTTVPSTSGTMTPTPTKTKKPKPTTKGRH